MDNAIMLVSMLVSFLAVAGGFVLFPYMSRRTVVFGISVPEEVYRDDRVAGLRRAYRNAILVSGVVFCAAVVLLVYLAGLTVTGQGIALSILIFVNLTVNGAVYLRAYHNMKRLKAENDWNKDAPQLVTVNTQFSRKRTALSPLWFITYLVVIAGTVAVSLFRYEGLPDRIPVTFNGAGQAVGFMEKSCRVLLYMPGIQIFIMLIMLFVYSSINQSRQQIDSANKEISLRQSIVFRYRWSAFTVYGGLLLLMVFALIQLTILGMLDSTVTVVLSLILPLIIIGAVAGLALTTGQSGSRVKVDGKSYPAPQKAAVREDDGNWKYGLLYYNPQDPSLFVEKRVGIGWTLNWGRPMAWVIMIGLLALILGSVVFSFTLGQ